MNAMEAELQKLREASDMVTLYGPGIIRALIILVVGLVLAKLILKYARLILRRLNLKEATLSVVVNVLFILIVTLFVAMAARFLGLEAMVIGRVIIAVSLILIGLVVIFRPLMPTLPFKVGNTIKTGTLLGKVEGTTLMNTRIRTFDGKTVFVPHSKVLNDYLINYHLIPNRQIRIDFPIGYGEDLLKAKAVLSEILAEDPRILKAPPARVFVIDLTVGGVQLAAWSWVKNIDYWRTRCDLLEKIKFRFDHEGIGFAMPRRLVHIQGASEDRMEVEDLVG
ncbi:MAG: mechanosensitive ion channel family protein [Deltaproteobacteria bacterium]|nr:mechanosensitive ion channel family protein [Deltaproteobacteria bacterium]